jgi:hypothetical protein|nr:MAG: hypothetical protein J07AB56_05850 [Candidatus Nanosalinarum sp. J07AB56]
MDKDGKRDRFGLKHLTTDQEIAISLLLFVLGSLLILSALIPLSRVADLGPALFGVVMAGAGYTFAIEAVRELEEEDHFLARLLEEQE